MKQVISNRGQIIVDDIPAPIIAHGHILVEVAYSLISTGTEISSLESSGQSLVSQALEQPERIQNLITYVKQQGINKTIAVIKNKAGALIPLGYSCSGRVIQVSEDITDIRPDDLVACAGVGLANHAEVILVPRNLIVKIPEGCDLKAAASVTLGAIAMQGVRRAGSSLGNVVAVIGLGLIGQITTQLLKVSGCVVLGFDLDPHRVKLAKQLGADHTFTSSQVDVLTEVLRRTGNRGVDATIITAASKSNAIVQQAMEITRKKGRVVVVGAVGLELQRSPFYEKEIDFLISCSYGPGRYDPDYEQQGIDYPYAYVRWTENRNMEEYLRLLSQKAINVDPILEQVYDIDQAQQAYASLRSGTQKPLAVLLRYPPAEAKTLSEKLLPRVNLLGAKNKSNKICVAIVGAGHFAREMHLPNLKKLSGRYQLIAIADTDGVNAKATASQWGARYATTSYEDILANENIHLVMICTRHNTHKKLALEALQAGKHVFVEKPLALTKTDLEQIEGFYSSDTSAAQLPLLLTGFNRRFSPFSLRIHTIVQGRSNPMILNYRMNAGYIPLDNWVHTAEGGGRNKGEACHVYDLFSYLTGSRVASVQAQAISPTTQYYSPSDNFNASLQFEDGSIANLTYTALGTSGFPKEQMEIYTDGKVLSLNDYKTLKIFGAPLAGIESRFADKGHLHELQALADAIQHGGTWPIPLWQQIQATQIALMVEDQLRS